ncbi:MAG TPA: hypothetical protein VJU86_06310 [Pyrinomonadaceae bacterium]|nr:hypothetical protein [Pyrinomonadaceae bacterium]
MSIRKVDISWWYSLSSDFMGSDYFLEGGGANSGSLMVKAENNNITSGQCWRFTPLPNGTYRLTNQFLGVEYALESSTDFQGCRMTPWTNAAGQQWVVVPERTGVYRMYTRLTGPLYALESNNPATGSKNDLGIAGSVMTEYKIGDPAGDGQLWTIKPYGLIYTWPDFNEMIPFDADFNIKVQGPALGNKPQSILFDTGSWDLCIPYSLVDKSKVRIISSNIKNCWQEPCDQVQGDLEVLTTDGTPYQLKNYTFYAAYDSNSKRIMGGFPSTGVFPYELAKAYPGTDTHGKTAVGFGIISMSTGSTRDVNADWGKFQPYLMFKPTAQVLKQLEWAMPIPAYQGSTVLNPHAVPGFNLTIEFAKNTSQGGELHYDNLDATIDTGAPELVTRLGPDDPQRNPPFKDYFTQPAAEWNQEYKDHSSIAVTGSKVTVKWIDGLGVHHSYKYLTNTSGPRCTQFMVGDFTSKVPWECDPPQITRTRFSLGNTIYFFWPIYYYDITQNRIGIATQG